MGLAEGCIIPELFSDVVQRPKSMSSFRRALWWLLVDLLSRSGLTCWLDKAVCYPGWNGKGAGPNLPNCLLWLDGFCLDLWIVGQEFGSKQKLFQKGV